MLQKYAPLRDECLRQYDEALSVHEYYERKKAVVTNAGFVFHKMVSLSSFPKPVNKELNVPPA
jgi:hypothetical protein